MNFWTILLLIVAWSIVGGFLWGFFKAAGADLGQWVKDRITGTRSE